MRTLIIGAGEVGTSLRDIISAYHETFIRDVEDNDVDEIEVLHICYPDSKDFVKITKDYVKKYKPKLTIVNSSVTIGTTNNLDNSTVYSPIRGRHPNLMKEIKVYPKFVAGKDRQSVSLAADYFRKCEMEVIESENPTAFEFCKLISNIHMGLEIAWRQEVERMLKVFNVDPEDYEKWEKSYAEGYLKLGQDHLVRPRMNPHPIGGHCILPCTDILSKSYHSKAFDFIKESNLKAGGENGA